MGVCTDRTTFCFDWRFCEKADGIDGEILPPAGRFCNSKEASDGGDKKVSSGKMRVWMDAQCLQKMGDKFC